MEKTRHKTIVLSDIHLGTSGSKAREVVQYLKRNSCDTLILNGDIVDGWQLRKYGAWKKKHTRFARAVMKMMQQNNTHVIYLRGNHDDFLDQVIPLRIGRHFYIQREFIYESFGRRYLVTHGDVFDSVTSTWRWVAMLGDVGYTFLLWVNKIYNRWRVRQGKPYYSLSQKIKNSVKKAVSFISEYEKELVELARSRKCDGVICGHIHQPAIAMIDGIQYLNSGDWVESLTALTEDYEGNWKLEYYLQTAPPEEQLGVAKEVDEEVDPFEEDFAEEASAGMLMASVAAIAKKDEDGYWE